MKNRIVIFMLLFCLMNSINSQGQFTRFEAGLEGGPVITTFWGNNYQNDIHYSQGSFFRFNPTKKLGIQTGVYFEKVGINLNINYVDSSGNIIGTGHRKYQNDYLTFPLLLKINAIDKKLKLNFTVGGFFSYLLTAKEIMTSSTPENPKFPNGVDELIYDMTNVFSRFNAGIVLGSGIDYTFSNRINIGFEVRDQLGLCNAPGPYYDPTPYDNIPYLRTNSLQFLFSLSYKFGQIKAKKAVAL